MSNISHFTDQCVYCDTKFNVTTEDEVEVIFCPFCGEELFDEDEDDEDDDEGFDYEEEDDWE